jgi:TetR/AcrR family transcriptional regulator, regulator of autoinduction and epiphytic fitness
MNTAPIVRVSFKQQMLKAREEAIVQVVNRLLAEKGFDAMTVDEVAAQVGIAKASLYKHFSSKEDLAAAAMVRVLRLAQAFVETVPATLAPVDKLKAVVRWMLGVKLAGDMPSLPNQNSSLRAALLAHKDYMDTLIHVSDTLGEWIEAAQAAGELNPALPPIAVLYTLYARACDPVLEFLKMGGTLNDDQVADLVMSTCFDGLRTR